MARVAGDWTSRRRCGARSSDVKDLRFDVQGQRCLVYASIRNVEEQLERELAHLAKKHGWPLP